MNKEVVEMINELAERFGTTAEHLWSVLVNQAAISGLMDILFIVILISIASVWIVFVLRKTADTSYNGWESEGKFFGYMSIFFVCFLGFFFIIFALQNIATAFFNPEYWALKQIIK